MSDLPAVLDQLIVSLAAFSGLVMESMTRSLGWRFLDLGRRLERAQQTTCLIASMLEHQQDVPGQLLEALLEAADSSMTYRSRYLADLQVAAVLDLLLTDETNPRSVAYQLVAVAEHVDNLPRDRSQPQLGEEQRLAMTLLHNVRMTDVTALAEQYSLGHWEPLGRILEDIEERLPRLSDAIYHRYLIHAGPSRQLSDIRPEACAVRYKITHTTKYAYSEPAPVCHNEVRLTPREDARQRCEAHRLLIKPDPANLGGRVDYFGNRLNCFSILEAHRRLNVTAVTQLDVAAITAPDAAASPPWETVRDALRQDISAAGLANYQFVFDSPRVKSSSRTGRLRRRVLPAAAADRGSGARPDATDSRTIHLRSESDDGPHAAGGSVRLAPRRMPGFRPCADRLLAQAWDWPPAMSAVISAPRPPPGKPRLVGADASHAWVSVYCGEVGLGRLRSHE